LDSTPIIKNTKSVREAVFLILWKGFCKDLYLEDVLPSNYFSDSRDQSLTYEICCGTIRYWSQLEWIAKQLTSTGKLSLKNREKSLLFPALYQIYYLERVPHYAIIDETVKLAKTYCHASMGSFFNGILRKASQTPLILPKSDSVFSLSIRYSQTPFFIEHLLNDRGLDKAKLILEASNTRPLHFARSKGLPFKYESVTSDLAQVEGYIQNPTPGSLIQFLSQSTVPPKSILDLCSSPGGKLLLAHDLYPEAKLWANDITESRIRLLNDNITKFGLDVDVRIGLGETYPTDRKFDLIILDVPCSNSGVLNKRVEARWRLSKEALDELKVIQRTLLKHATELLAPGGSIWFLTCSILKEENEGVADVPYLRKVSEMTHFPDSEGMDGGYGCHLKKE
jgi:16S rRNA (cytosine967-C5)-methyltransferase